MIIFFNARSSGDIQGVVTLYIAAGNIVATIRFGGFTMQLFHKLLTALSGKTAAIYRFNPSPSTPEKLLKSLVFSCDDFGFIHTSDDVIVMMDRTNLSDPWVLVPVSHVEYIDFDGKMDEHGAHKARMLIADGLNEAVFLIKFT